MFLDLVNCFSQLTVFSSAYLGKISLVKQLNRTLHTMHRFTVRATIGSAYSEAVVVVNVLDVNNNCPVFAQSQVTSRLSNPVEIGTIVAWNKVSDADASPLTYTITSGDIAGMQKHFSFLPCIVSFNRLEIIVIRRRKTCLKKHQKNTSLLNLQGFCFKKITTCQHRFNSVYNLCIMHRTNELRGSYINGFFLLLADNEKIATFAICCIL